MTVLQERLEHKKAKRLAIEQDRIKALKAKIARREQEEHAHPREPLKRAFLSVCWHVYPWAGSQACLGKRLNAVGSKCCQIELPSANNFIVSWKEETHDKNQKLFLFRGSDVVVVVHNKDRSLGYIPCSADHNSPVVVRKDRSLGYIPCSGFASFAAAAAASPARLKHGSLRPSKKGHACNIRCLWCSYNSYPATPTAATAPTKPVPPAIAAPSRRW